MGLSHPTIESLINQLKFMAMEGQTENKLASRLGAKITGAGKGGDILVLSLFEKSTHQNLVAKLRQKGQIIHFDSSELSDDWNSPVPGVRKENL
jgi:mevalonate kinase